MFENYKNKIFEKYFRERIEKELKEEKEILRIEQNDTIEKVAKELEKRAEEKFLEKYIQINLEKVKLPLTSEDKENIYEMNKMPGFKFIKKFLERQKTALGKIVLQSDWEGNEDCAIKVAREKGKFDEIIFILSFVDSVVKEHSKNIEKAKKNKEK